MTELTKSLHADPLAEFLDAGGVEIVNTFGEPQLEYSAIRKGCGLNYLPSRGILEVGGVDRHAFLGNLLTNRVYDVASKQGMQPGEGRHAYFLNLKGRIVAEMNLIERGEHLWIETEARLVPVLRETFDKYLFAEKVTLVDRVAAFDQLRLLGPGAPDVLRDATGVDVASLAPIGSVHASVAGVGVTLVRDDLTASPGFAVIVEREKALGLWTRLVEAFGQPTGLQQAKRRLHRVGWAALNACRIEAGRPMLGIDYEPAPPSKPGRRKEPQADAESTGPTPGVLPAELGRLEHAVDFNKGCYLGQEVVARMHSRGVLARKVIGFRMTDDALPIAGAPVQDEAGNAVGIVTSSTVSPVLGNACIGLALVKKPWFETGKTLHIPAEGAIRPATVVELPFLK